MKQNLGKEHTVQYKIIIEIDNAVRHSSSKCRSYGKNCKNLPFVSRRNDSSLWRQPRHSITGEINHSVFRNRLSFPLLRKNVEKCSHPVAPFLNRCTAIQQCVPSGIRPTLTFCDPCDDNGVSSIALRRWRSILQIYCKQVAEENALIWNERMGEWKKFRSKGLHDF